MSVEYYIYYQIPGDRDREMLRTRIHDMQTRIAHHTGITGRLLERRDDALTWMEIYVGITDTNAFDAALTHEYVAAGLHELTSGVGTRHIERFVECA